jgi:hypothetical protein
LAVLFNCLIYLHDFLTRFCSLLNLFISIFFSQKFPYVRQQNCILSFRKGYQNQEKKNRGFLFKKNIDDVIFRKQMTAWNSVWYQNMYFFPYRLEM